MKKYIEKYLIEIVGVIALFTVANFGMLIFRQYDANRYNVKAEIQMTEIVQKVATSDSVGKSERDSLLRNAQELRDLIKNK